MIRRFEDSEEDGYKFHPMTNFGFYQSKDIFDQGWHISTEVI